ncbi:MAG: 5' nucleotidase, NT5C type [Candidatus Hodarchaeales archaeon]|jgi:5'(3')-deoxyribonucleotidase
MEHNCKCTQKIIALDVESVLADIHSAWITQYKKTFTKDDITDWDFKSLRKWKEDLKTFLDETDNLWVNNSKKIPPTVPNLKEATRHLKPFDIVTSRRSLGGIIKWVEYHQLEYRAIVYVPDDKADLDYCMYVDDNPNLAKKLKDNQFLWLISQPYNLQVKESSQIRRVNSILETTGRKI